MLGPTEGMRQKRQSRGEAAVQPGTFVPAGPFIWESISFPSPDPRRSSKLDLIRIEQAGVSKKTKNNLILQKLKDRLQVLNDFVSRPL